MSKNPYIWIVQYEWRSPSGEWKPGLDCYESLNDAEAQAALQEVLTDNYRSVKLTGRDVQTRQYVAELRTAADQRAVAGF